MSTCARQDESRSRTAASGGSISVQRCLMRPQAVERDAADWLRRTADVVVSSLLLVLFLVPMLLIALTVHLEGKGPAFFRQQRMGLGGPGFMLFKSRTMFRTMFRGAEFRQLRERIAREL